MIDLTKRIQSCREDGTKGDSLRIYRLHVRILSLLSEGRTVSAEKLVSGFDELLSAFVPVLAESFHSLSFDEEDIVLLKNSCFSNVFSSLLLFGKYESANRKNPLILIDCLKRILCASRAFAED